MPHDDVGLLGSWGCGALKCQGFEIIKRFTCTLKGTSLGDQVSTRLARLYVAWPLRASRPPASFPLRVPVLLRAQRVCLAVLGMSTLKRAEHDMLLSRIPWLDSLQAAWLLLHFCVVPRSKFLLRAVPMSCLNTVFGRRGLPGCVLRVQIVPLLPGVTPLPHPGSGTRGC